ncbi:MAG TPA: pseudouridine-5'-phosphate glycosidase, partial [Trueperaceae bacterium]|nr:pseudouridine-5'-phosphate glycosidase [Trueperaceae bacterium]
MSVTGPVRTSPDVAAALARGAAVVALESTVVTHGLPRPQNLELARRLEEVVREAGAVPATVA